MLSLPDGHERVFLDAKAFAASYSRSALNLSPCHLKWEKCFTFTFLMFSLKYNTQLLPQVFNTTTIITILLHLHLQLQLPLSLELSLVVSFATEVVGSPIIHLLTPS